MAASSGGVGILQMLGVLEGTDFATAGAGSAKAVHYMTEAMRHFFADRSQNLGDPDFVKVPIAAMLNPNYILKVRGAIDPEKATPSSQVKGTVFTGHESEQTTHYTIADDKGNVVAVTYTLNDQYGNKITANGLGFLLNNEMGDFASQPGIADASGRILGEADAIAPRKTPLSSMTPTIVLKDGRKLHKYIEHAIGSLEVPMTDSALETKFSDLAEGILPGPQIRRLMDACWGVEKLPSAAAIAQAAVV